jgi:hypothetical protein
MKNFGEFVMFKQAFRVTFTGLQLRKSICDTRPLDVGYVVNKLAVGQVYLRVVLVSVISSTALTYSTICY